MVNKLSCSDKDWLGQQVLKITKWNCRYWMTEKSFNEKLSYLELNTLIEKSDRIFKNDRTTTVVKIEQGGGSFVLKRYNARNQMHKIKRAFRQSRASRCWQMSYLFQRAGLNVSEPVLMFEKRFGPIRSEAYFLNNHLVGSELLSLLPEMSNNDQIKVKKAIMDAFEKMQRNKISHGDMKASNLMWVNGGLFFIDLDASRKHLTSIGWKLAHKKDKKRFMKNWKNHPKLIELFHHFSE